MIIFLDTETGGLQPRHSTIEVGACTLDGDEFTSFVRPNSGDFVVDPSALAINRIDLRSAENWPRADDVAKNLVAWIRALVPEGKVTACGMNVGFDVLRVNALCRDAGLDEPFSHRVIDMVSVAQFLGVPDPRGTSLIERYGRREDGEMHTALADARHARSVYKALRTRR